MEIQFEWTQILAILAKAGIPLALAAIAKYFFQWLSSREVRIKKGDTEFVFKGIGCEKEARELIRKLSDELDGENRDE